jgi:hypothetical protein
MRSPETWDAARAAYLAGESAQSVCERFDLGLSALRDRARREGWRRADAPDPDPAADDDLFDDQAPLPSRQEMMDTLWRIAARALRRGRTAEAHRCLAAHARLVEQARADQRAEQRAENEAKAVEDRGAVQRIRAIGHAARDVRDAALDKARQTERELHQLHQLHHDSGEPPDTGPPDRPLTRAERRRLEKMKRKR